MKTIYWLIGFGVLAALCIGVSVAPMIMGAFAGPRGLVVVH